MPSAWRVAIRDLPRSLQFKQPSRLEALGTDDIREQISPRGIVLLDQRDLPITPPPLQGALALRSHAGILMLLEVDEPPDPIAPCKAIQHTFAMLPRAIGESACHADVQHAARTASQNVDVECLGWSLAHRPMPKTPAKDPGSARCAPRPGTQVVGLGNLGGLLLSSIPRSLQPLPLRSRKPRRHAFSRTRGYPGPSPAHCFKE